MKLLLQILIMVSFIANLSGRSNYKSNFTTDFNKSKIAHLRTPPPLTSPALTAFKPAEGAIDISTNSVPFSWDYEATKPNGFDHYEIYIMIGGIPHTYNVGSFNFYVLRNLPLASNTTYSWYIYYENNLNLIVPGTTVSATHHFKTGNIAFPNIVTNDEIGEAISLTDNTPVAGTTFRSTPSSPSSVCNLSGTNDVWYQFDVASSANIQICVSSFYSFSAITEVYTWDGLSLNNVGQCGGNTLNANLNPGHYYLRCSNISQWDGDFLITLNPVFEWRGTISSEWSLAENWKNNIKPSNNFSDNVNVPFAANIPILSYGAVMNNLQLDGNIDINGFGLEMGGSLSGTGKVKGSPTSTLAIGRVNQSADVVNLSFVPSFNKLKDLEIYYGTFSLTDHLNIFGKLSVNQGAILNTNDNLTLKSDNNNTAVTGDLTNANINGKVTVERYIPNGLRVFRDLGAGGVNPVDLATGSIFSNWQEGGVNNNGYGIKITGQMAVADGIGATGYDYSTTGNPSLFTFTGNNWNAVTSGTNNKPLDPYQGFRVLVRGNRSHTAMTESSNISMTEAATLRATGNLITGDVVFGTGGVTGNYPSSYSLSSGTNSYSFVSNPYASVVDWHAVVNNSTDIHPTYWYCDPTFTIDQTSSFVGFTTYEAYNVTTGPSNPLGQSKINRYLMPGQAFFVQNDNASPTLKFTEGCKTPTQAQTSIFGTATPVNRIALGLYKNGTNVDGAVLVFGKGFSKTIGKEDAVKFSNGGENVAITQGKTDLCINGTSMPTSSDAYPLHLYSLQANTAYAIRLDVNQFNGNGTVAYLKDNVTAKETLLVGDSTVLSFSTNSVNATSFANRYSIVFAASTLPISSINLTASKLQGNSVELNWTSIGEGDGTSYKVEHSVNGIDFTDLTTIDGTSYVDSKATDGINYYRIKATDKNGEITYSNVVRLTTNNSPLTTIAIYPNPLSGSSFSVSLGNVVAGRYKVSIFDKLGKLVFGGILDHTSSTEKIDLGKQLAGGSYTVSVLGENGASYSTELEVR